MPDHETDAGDQAEGQEWTLETLVDEVIYGAPAPPRDQAAYQARLEAQVEQAKAKAEQTEREWAEQPWHRNVPALVALESRFVSWRNQVEAAAEAARVTPPESPELLPDDLAQRVALLGRVHDYWRHAVDQHARLVADEERNAKVVGVRIPMLMRQQWYLETHYLHSIFDPIAARYGESRAEANAHLVSQRWRPQDPTSDVQAIMREVEELPYQVVAAALAQMTMPESLEATVENQMGLVPQERRKLVGKELEAERGSVRRVIAALTGEGLQPPSVRELAKRLVSLEGRGSVEAKRRWLDDPPEVLEGIEVRRNRRRARRRSPGLDSAKSFSESPNFISGSPKITPKIVPDLR